MADHDSQLDGHKPDGDGDVGKLVDPAKEMRSSLERILMIAVHKMASIQPNSPEGMIWRNIYQITMKALCHKQTGLMFVLCAGGQLVWLGRRVIDVALAW